MCVALSVDVAIEGLHTRQGCRCESSEGAVLATFAQQHVNSLFRAFDNTAVQRSPSKMR